ncbi:MAG TPA: DoxX family protein [Solirubrobacterales bacterium]|nr:DoxX family protein [Solirubrobacterales bacterium]
MNLALLALRLVVGLLFAGHGAQKLAGSFGGTGIAGTAETFEKLRLRPARAHAIAAGCAELGGGLLLALGLLTPLGAAALIAVMTTAVITVHARNGVWNTEQGFEYNLVLVAAAFAVAAADSGAWSLDRALGLDLGGTGWALIALGAGLLGGIGAVLGGRGWEDSPRERGEEGRFGGGPGPAHPHAR